MLMPFSTSHHLNLGKPVIHDLLDVVEVTKYQKSIDERREVCVGEVASFRLTVLDGGWEGRVKIIPWIKGHLGK